MCSRVWWPRADWGGPSRPFGFSHRMGFRAPWVSRLRLGGLADRVPVLWPTLAGVCFGSACIPLSTPWPLRRLCGNGEWGRRPGTQSTRQG